jgi:hypothetical protein
MTTLLVTHTVILVLTTTMLPQMHAVNTTLMSSLPLNSAVLALVWVKWMAQTTHTPTPVSQRNTRITTLHRVIQSTPTATQRWETPLTTPIRQTQSTPTLHGVIPTPQSRSITITLTH